MRCLAIVCGALLLVGGCTSESQDGGQDPTPPPAGVTTLVAPPTTTAPSPTATTTSPPTNDLRGSWRTIDTGLGGGFLTPELFWTGDRLLVFFGATAEATTVAGAVVDPAGGDARRIDDGGLEWRAGHAATWTGSQLVVYGGSNGPGIDVLGGVYDLAADAWRPMTPAPMGLFSTDHAFWTGAAMVTIADDRVVLYVPDDDEWTVGATLPLLAERARYAAVWTGEELLVWGGCAREVPQCDDFTTGEDELTGGAAYDPAGDSWRMLRTSPLAPRDRPVAIWTGEEMIVWGGNVPDGAEGGYGAAYDPASDSWRVIADAPIRERSLHSVVWTGSEMIVWGGEGGLRDGAAYDPASDSWRLLPQAPVAGRDRHEAVWTGTEMIVVGGWPAGEAIVYTP